MRRRRIAVGIVVAAVAALSAGRNADLREPPRYDGAGYSVLALSLRDGRGYREIDRPDAPRHGHFPPGYPLTLAGLWTVTGRSVVAAHGFSILCTVTAAWLAWRWFRTVEPPRVADRLGLALAVNWTWGAVGGAIQSEALYLLLSMAVLHVARAPGGRAGLGIGVLLGSCVLTRHVGICLVVAVLLDRLLLAGQGRAGGGRRHARRWRDATIIGLASLAVIGPWVAWLASVRRNTQVGLLDPNGLIPRLGSQSIFYIRRMPDALSGPFIEVATVFGRSRAVGVAATAAAVIVSGVIAIGWVRCLIDPRRRLAGLVPLVTLPLLLIWPFTEAGRFLIPLVPSLLVGMVEGLAWCLRGLGRARNPRRLASVFVLCVAIPFPAYTLITHRAEARRRSHDAFDAACAWIAREGRRPGPVLTRHPGEVFWQTGRHVVFPDSDDVAGLARQIAEHGVAYVLVDEGRFANEAPTALARLAAERPGLVRRVYEGPVAVDEVITAP